MDSLIKSLRCASLRSIFFRTLPSTARGLVGREAAPVEVGRGALSATDDVAGDGSGVATAGDAGRATTAGAVAGTGADADASGARGTPDSGAGAGAVEDTAVDGLGAATAGDAGRATTAGAVAETRAAADTSVAGGVAVDATSPDSGAGAGVVEDTAVANEPSRSPLRGTRSPLPRRRETALRSRPPSGKVNKIACQVEAPGDRASFHNRPSCRSLPTGRDDATGNGIWGR